MDVLSAIKDRRSIRKYSDKPVEEEKLLKVLEAARLAPSARNEQNWKFIVVKDPETKEKLTEAIGQSFVGEAPIILVSCGTETKSVMRGGQPRYTVDLSIATAYMILEAYEQGLGTCWLGSYDEDKVKKVLGIPEDVRVVAITPLGYPAESPAPRPRKELDEIVCYDKFC
ncbi:nitroreductase [Keratinibaculum paraultunense]|uniref:Nitroreductase n=1 Tax=Keratinibaculum paraultunense TaxID=1278232 RepID=A0A4R3KSI0_9FIRM|nr:nitroreductase family protein [Keratinibaculum paraultunense]QQY78813.1 nitroreductase family protein [Keratinibaculum paraultunense]TCS87477.1 nitroreductase [Keratinibaculum paraultunense]